MHLSQFSRNNAGNDLRSVLDGADEAALRTQVVQSCGEFGLALAVVMSRVRCSMVGCTVSQGSPSNVMAPVDVLGTCSYFIFQSFFVFCFFCRDTELAASGEEWKGGWRMGSKKMNKDRLSKNVCECEEE